LTIFIHYDIIIIVGGIRMTYEKEMERGIVKKIDNLGRITIPKAWRQVVGIEANQELNVFLIDNETIGIKINESTL
jgi:AbrB family looped-hinge helix DNA binding protein